MNLIALPDLKKLEPMKLFESAARSILPNLPQTWPKMEEELKGCKMRIHTGGLSTEQGLVVLEVIGLGERAEYYQDHYSKSFSNVLVGILNVPRVRVDFLTDGESS